MKRSSRVHAPASHKPKLITSRVLVFGQIIFGYLADVLGRKKMYGVELMIIISTTLAQSLCGESTAVSVVAVLIFCEFGYR